MFGRFFSEIAPWGDIQEHKRRIFRLIIGRPSALKKELPNVFTSSPRMTFQIFCLAKLNICLKKSFTVKNPFHFICQMSKRMWSANLWNYKLPPTCIRLHTGSKWTFFDQKFVLFFVNSRWSKNLSKTIKNNRNDRKCQKIEKCNFCPVCICVLTMTL